MSWLPCNFLVSKKVCNVPRSIQLANKPAVIIVVEHVRFERPNLSVEVWANKSGLFRGLFYDFCDAISNAPKTVSKLSLYSF